MQSCVTGGHLKEFTDGESNFTALLQRAMEMEGVDRETLHQLVSLLMKVSLFTCAVVAMTCLLSWLCFCAVIIISLGQAV